METTMMPGCCGLKILHRVACLGKADEFSKKEAKGFEDLTKVGTAMAGNWNTYGKALDTMVVITDSPRYNKPEAFEAQKKFLNAKKWELLATWKSYESNGTNYLYGSPGITNK